MELDYCGVAKELYALPSDYKLVFAAEGSRVIDCPAGHIAVYAHHFEFGLRFPLDPVLVKILKAFSVCLAQLTPLAMRNLIAYVWVCRYLGFPETLNLFHRLNWLRQKGYAEKGWWSLTTAEDKMTVYPKMSGLKGWQGAFYWRTGPTDFPLRRHFTKMFPRMEDVPSYDLSEAEQGAFDYFESEPEVGEGDESETRIPCTWFPHAKYIFSNEPLFSLFLCRTHAEGLT